MAIEPDYVDVGRPRRDAIQDLRAFIDHRIHHALETLLVADDALLDAEAGKRLVYQILDLRVGQRRAAVSFILVIALPIFWRSVRLRTACP